MKLIPNWAALYLRLSSNQLNLLAALIGAIYAYFDARMGGSSWIIATIMACFNLGASIFRMFAQPETVAKVEAKAEAKKLETLRQDL